MTQSTQVPDVDPLEAFEKRPSVSFDASRGGYAKGQIAQLVVQSYGNLIVDRDPETKEVKFWPLRQGETEAQPKKKYVLNVLDLTDTSEEGGVEKTLWAKPVRKGQAMFAALIAAQNKVKADTGNKSYRLAPGDELQIVYVGDDTTVPAKMGNHPKKFKARIIPGAHEVAARPEDPFADDAPSSGGSDPWAEETPHPAPRQIDADPFGGSDVAEDEPPF